MDAKDASGNPLIRNAPIAEALAVAERHFLLALRGDEVLLNAALALRAILAATAAPDINTVSVAQRARVAQLAADVAPTVRAAAGDDLDATSERGVYFGLGAASGLVRLLGPDDEDTPSRASFRERVDWTAYVANHFDGLHRMRRIEGGGNALWRQVCHLEIMRGPSASAAIN